ncbi:MAG: hypothetical protein ACRDSR_22800 [Pseudonocardiaceae bacterium]
MDDSSTPANTTSSSLVTAELRRSGIAGADGLDYSPAAAISALPGAGGGDDLGDAQDGYG